jgi:hypothetical protein
MAIYWQVIDLGDDEQMVRYESFSCWGMIETSRTEVYRRKWEAWQGQEECEIELPKPPPAVRGEEMGLLPGPPPDERSPMQQAILDAGLAPLDGAVVPAFKTNEGTVFLGSPADIARMEASDAMGSAKWARLRKPSNAEIDRMMGQEGDDESKWRRW